MIIKRSTLLLVIPIILILFTLASLKKDLRERVATRLGPSGREPAQLIHDDIPVPSNEVKEKEKVEEKVVNAPLPGDHQDETPKNTSSLAGEGSDEEREKAKQKAIKEEEEKKKPKPLKKHPLTKPRPSEPPVPIEDNFPLAVKATSRDDLPPVPSWNRPPSPHVKESTPLYIGFTRNWRLLQQTVVSYITAGWPPEDIYVVDNSGTMDSNKHGLLTLQNPFYLDYRRLTEVFGVNVITTPTLLTFAQMQNFFLFDALQKNRTHYFWGHMDVVAVSKEDKEDFQSLYMFAVEGLREALAPGFARDDNGREGRWGIRFFAYDRLALVNALAFNEVGGWDPQIGYYLTDCDMHERLSMAGFKQGNAWAGLVYDTGSSLDDLLVLFRRKPLKSAKLAAQQVTESTTAKGEAEVRSKAVLKDKKPSVTPRQSAIDARFGPEDKFNSPAWLEMVHELDAMQVAKNSAKGGRNFWQRRQSGGQGEPFYRDPEGFERALVMTIDRGRDIFAEKWGHRECNLIASGLGAKDAWRVDHDWD
ncbi:MAG: hypothetical protein M1825_003985 [Sarcosagium campestre]|nr:MAG: hypothetical protein M1825_003985 [Sarcosagium campestre]